jgi:hypothetical protein
MVVIVRQNLQETYLTTGSHYLAIFLKAYKDLFLSMFSKGLQELKVLKPPEIKVLFHNNKYNNKISNK